MTLFHSIWTLLSLLLFIGICWWAYSSARGTRFNAAAQLPFLDEPRRDETRRSEAKRDATQCEDGERHG